ncbi:SAM-dependent methyltransferase [Spirillospora sp. CA-128828]|uniref:SAM-dependent methyltransferase n=1 Tax=Spirillospora sp. CA-128828 TaxID=3240033 RepID=UPI003D8C9453
MTGDSTPQDPARPQHVDSSVPHTARVWNYWLGGKDNYIADRRLGDQIQEVIPDIVASARADRGFLGRAVRHLAGEAGIRQFLDLGTGLPTAGNTHEVAQAIAPEARIVYVDNDRLLEAVPSGSHLAIAHPTGEVNGEAAQQAVDMSNDAGVAPMCLRSRAELERFFDGLELLEPGVVSCSQWRADVRDVDRPPAPVYQFCGLGRKH